MQDIKFQYEVGIWVRVSDPRQLWKFLDLQNPGSLSFPKLDCVCAPGSWYQTKCMLAFPCTSSQCGLRASLVRHGDRLRVPPFALCLLPLHSTRAGLSIISSAKFSTLLPSPTPNPQWVKLILSTSSVCINTEEFRCPQSQPWASLNSHGLLLLVTLSAFVGVSSFRLGLRFVFWASSLFTFVCCLLLYTGLSFQFPPEHLIPTLRNGSRSSPPEFSELDNVTNVLHSLWEHHGCYPGLCVLLG